MITTIAKLKIGQRFSFIPSEWYGQCKLTVKDERQLWTLGGSVQCFDIKFDANPPGVIYGIYGSTKVRLLSSKPRLQTKGHRAGYRV